MKLKKALRRYTPDPHSVRQSRALRFLGDFLHDTRLWQFNRRSVANAMALGLFAMWIPVPLQMVLVAIVALPLRANLPLAIALVWITNPFTVPPMYVGAYLFGSWVLGLQAQDVEFALSIEWLNESLGLIWEPFLLGCFLLGVIGATLGYLGVQIAWRGYLYLAINQRRLRKRR